MFFNRSILGHVYVLILRLFFCWPAVVARCALIASVGLAVVHLLSILWSYLENQTTVLPRTNPNE